MDRDGNGNLPELFEGILRNLSRQQGFHAAGAFGTHVRTAIERELTPRIEEGLRCVVTQMREDLAQWTENLRELEGLCSNSEGNGVAHPEIEYLANPPGDWTTEQETRVEAPESTDAELDLAAPGKATDCDTEVGLTFDAGAPLAPPLAIESPHEQATSVPEEATDEARRLAEAHFREGIAHQQRNELGSAIDAFSEAIAAAPTYLEAYLERGQALRRRGDYEPARADFTAALQLQTNNGEAYLRRGNVHLDLNRVEEALDDYTKAIEFEPGNAAAFMNRALAHARRENWEQAVADATEALNRNPRLKGAYFVRAAALARLDAHDDALLDLDLLIRLDPQNVLAYNERGLVLVERGEYDRAIGDYTQALRLRPKFMLARSNRAVALRLKGDLDLASAEFDRLVRMMPGNPVVYYQRGLTRLARHEWGGALADFDKALRLNPGLLEARRACREAKRAFDEERARAEADKLESQTQPAETASTPKPVPPPARDLFMPIQCPACATKGKIRITLLAYAFQCRSCKRRYRLHADGKLVEILPPPSVRGTLRHLAGAAVRPLRAAAALVVIALLGWGGWSLARAFSASELPVELEARAELMGRAWLGKDTDVLGQLTAPEQKRALIRWLEKNPAPEFGGDLSDTQLARHASIGVTVVETNDEHIQVTIRVTIPTGSWAQITQYWLRDGDMWFFSPTDPRHQQQQSLSHP